MQNYKNLNKAQHVINKKATTIHITACRTSFTASPTWVYNTKTL